MTNFNVTNIIFNDEIINEVFSFVFKHMSEEETKEFAKKAKIDFTTDKVLLDKKMLREFINKAFSNNEFFEHVTPKILENIKMAGSPDEAKDLEATLIKYCNATQERAKLEAEMKDISEYKKALEEFSVLLQERLVLSDKMLELDKKIVKTKERLVLLSDKTNALLDV